MNVRSGKKIKMDYELAVDGGDVVESSADRGPLEYIHGSGAMLPRLEHEMEGMTVGEERSGVIPAAEAYGTEETLPTLEVGRNQFPDGEEPTVGKPFEARDPQGNTVSFTVVEVREQTAIVRLNHPLAGKDIRFRVKVIEISDPN